VSSIVRDPSFGLLASTGKDRSAVLGVRMSRNLSVKADSSNEAPSLTDGAVFPLTDAVDMPWSAISRTSNRCYVLGAGLSELTTTLRSAQGLLTAS